MFSNELMRLSGEMGSYIMAPTNEEFILSMAEYGLSSYRQLPIRMFQIADKFRNIKKPKGLLRSKQFLMCDMCSIDVSPESLQESAKLFEHAVQGAFRRFDLHYYRLEKNEGNYVDFVIPCKEGETKVDVKKDGSATYARPEDRDAQKMSSVAMYFVFPHQEDFSAVFLDKNDAQQHICLGTYGFGIQRSLHAIAEQHRDKYGINFPEDVRLFDVAIIPVDSQNENHRNKSEELYDMIMRRRKEPVLDDRINMTLRERASYADFLGVPKKVFIGDEEIRKERVTVKNRGELEGKEVDINQFLRSIGAVSLGDLFI
jgi:prolyl-tRNA synthetase